MDLVTLLRVATSYARLNIRPEASWCIAGGSVRDALIGRRPEDVDIYILGSGSGGTGPIFETEDYYGLKFQIMHTVHKAPEKLIQSFDWSICACAILPDGMLLNPYEVERVIDEHRDLTLINVTNPYSNLRRGYRFSERYDLRIPTSTLRYLFKACLDSTQFRQYDPVIEDRQSGLAPCWRRQGPEIQGPWSVNLPLADRIDQLQQQLEDEIQQGMTQSRSVRDNYEGTR